MERLKPIDHAALNTNQASLITLLVLAFLFNVPVLVGLVSLFMLVGAAVGRPGFGWVYARLLRPRGWVKPDVLLDNPEPHRFAQGFGGVVTLLSTLSLLGGLAILGWALTWLVIGLAALNLFGGFCVGCAMYYWLNRLHVPGFVKAPPAGTLPGLRPRRHSSERA